MAIDPGQRRRYESWAARGAPESARAFAVDGNSTDMERRTITVSGTVQGVGYRPFVYGLAARMGLAGFVRNRACGVEIEAEGPADALDAFVAALARQAPPLARIDQIHSAALPPRGASRFRINASGAPSEAVVFMPPDVATCEECLRELFDPADRRYRYPFLNCSDCGPRLTLVNGTPYDRERTAMAAFPMCDTCRNEYEDPTNRRFHAEPLACAACGPRLVFRDPTGREAGDGNPLASAIAALHSGWIVAVKGLGGYHLACNAMSEAAVARLRRRKHRDEKPFAVMVADLAAAERLCPITPHERALLESPRRPIVILRRRIETAVADAVAPRNPFLGVMLAYSPLHHLLLHDFAGALVMTSGNRSDEPMAHDDADVFARLGGIADFFLGHDRAIEIRCDDSVTRSVGGAELLLRRSRGYTPEPIALPVPCARPILATGGQWKAVFALGTGHYAIASHHLGDLDDYGTYAAYADAIERYERLFSVRPEVIVHDLHPDYASTRYALERAARDGLERIGVQHHHAHVVSCLAENGVVGPAIGVAFDGTGYGADGTIWGGEFLLVDGTRMRRAAHLRRVPLPGGERAIREPWRAALAQLADASESFELLASFASPAEIALVARMLERRVNAPMASSAGRLFDAVAAIAGVRGRVSYEGQAAIELEWLASATTAEGAYPFAISSDGPESLLEIDTRPLVRAVVRDVGRGAPAADVARRFHAAIVDMVVETCRRLRAQSDLATVALTGGVFMNAHLAAVVPERLEREGFRVHRHRRVPPNDGGLCLGQLAVAALGGVAGASR
jgi:hydrogenase maturation protein HypF